MSEGRAPRAGVLVAVTTLVLALALGACGSTDPGPVGSSPTPSMPPSPSVSPTATPRASPSATPQGEGRIWVYFARDQLPPVGAYVRGTFDDSSAERRIASRLTELQRAGADEIPAEPAANPAGLIGRDGVLEMAVRVEGDLATVEFGQRHFDRISSSAMTIAVVRQLVYTITEEPGIRRALLAEQGKSELIIDQAVIDAPLSREDVLPYRGVKTEERIELDGDPRSSETTLKLDESDPSIARVIIDIEATDPPTGSFWSPRLLAALVRNENEQDTPGKWLLHIGLTGARDPDLHGDRAVESTPIRLIRTEPFPPIETQPGATGSPTGHPGLTYTLALDDARPWRVSLEPGTPGTMRLIVDIGGHPQAVSDSIAVYEPAWGAKVARTFSLRGTARAFEARVGWRLIDKDRRELATGFTTASLGTSPVWGTFETEVRVPDAVSGTDFVTLEVFWSSPRDGSDVGKVALSIGLR